MIELLIAMLILAILTMIAMPLFAKQKDTAHDSRARAQLATAFKDMRSQNYINGRSYPLSHVKLAQMIQHSQPQFDVHPYEGGENPSTGPESISVTVEDHSMATACNHSESGLYFCIRGDELAMLAQSDAPGAEDVGPAAEMISRCTARSEPDARACLATRSLYTGEDDGPTQTGTAGWVDGSAVPEPEDDPEYVAPRSDDGEHGSESGSEEDQSEQADQEGGAEDPGSEGDEGPGWDDPGSDQGGEQTDQQSDDEQDGDDEPGAPAEEGDDEGGDHGTAPPPALSHYKLTVHVEGPGRVVGDGINCPGDCSQTYEEGSEVSLARTVSNEFSAFRGWQGAGCAGLSQGCDVQMNADRSVSATFEQLQQLFGGDSSAEGITADEIVMMKNSNAIYGTLGTNGLITMKNSNLILSTELAPDAPEPNIGSSSIIYNTTRRDAPFLIPLPDLGNTAQANDNFRILSGQDPSWNVSYDATSRKLELGNSATLTLTGGTYNFCEIELGNSASINVAPGSSARIYLDSPERLGSGCEAGTGNLIGENSGTFNNNGTDAADLILIAYGSTFGTTIDMKNSAALKMGIYAPRSNVSFKNSFSMVGGIVARTVEMKNSVTFTWDDSLALEPNAAP